MGPGNFWPYTYGCPRNSKCMENSNSSHVRNHQAINKRQHGQTEKWSEPIGKKFKHIQEINEMLLNASQSTVEFVRNLLKNP